MIGYRNNSNAKVFLHFVMAIVALIVLTSFLGTYFVVSHSLEKTYHKFLNQKISSIQGSIGNFMSVRHQGLEGHAAQPLIANSVMQLDQNLSTLDDFMADLRLLGQPVPLALLNINGEIIQTSINYSSDHFRDLPWVNQIIEEGLTWHVELEEANGNLFITYAVPVLYNDYPEGILIARSAVEDSEFLRFLGQSEGEIKIDIMQDGKNIKSFGSLSKGADYVQSEKFFDDIDSNIRMRLEVRGLDEAIYEMLSLLAPTLLVVALMIVFFFRRLGNRLFVEPQLRLEASRREVATANERLEGANDELRQFAYRTSHDLKAPLITIQGLSNVLLEDLEDGEVEQVKDNVQRIRIQANRLENLVTDILELCRADLADSRAENIDLIKIVDRIKENLSHSISENQVLVSTSVNQDWQFKSQPTRIAQVLENLISNGIKYKNDDAGSCFVKVSSLQDKENFMIVVEDNGMGIPDECQKDVFSMFTRFHPDTSIGSGLGLSLVKKHLDKLGAKIAFESSTAGTRFVLTFSRVSKPD